MKELAVVKNAAVSDIMARLAEFDDNERFAVFAATFSELVNSLKQDPVDAASKLVVIHWLLTRN